MQYNLLVLHIISESGTRTISLCALFSSTPGTEQFLGVSQLNLLVDCM